MDYTKPSIQSPNPNSTMAIHFIKALAKIQQSTTIYSSFGGRSRRINRAAYASMAISAGPRRAWSHALLRRLRSRRWRQYQRARVRVRVSRLSLGEPNQVQSLRRLVPGGKSMELCCLLEETASFVQCLRDQVGIEPKGHYQLGGCAVLSTPSRIDPLNQSHVIIVKEIGVTYMHCGSHIKSP